MRLKLAAALQLLGLLGISTAAFLTSLVLGLLVAGAAMLAVGVAVERAAVTA